MKFVANYSIKDLEKLSGIKAHTLRIWEKRYNLFEPDRTDTNIRYYSNDDLKRILNISLLNKNGLKISKIAALNEAEINQKVSEINMIKTEDEDLIDNFIVSMIDIDEKHFSKTFSTCILRMGFENAITRVIFPLFNRIGVMWQSGNINPAQEHFVSNIIRQKMIVAIDGLNPSVENGKAVVLFLPENELHELSLLFYNYALKSRGFKTFYLGQTVPSNSLARIIEITNPDYLIAVVTNPFSKKETKAFFENLAGICGTKKLLLSGRAVINSKKSVPTGFTVFADLQELLTLVA